MTAASPGVDTVADLRGGAVTAASPGVDTVVGLRGGAVTAASPGVDTVAGLRGGATTSASPNAGEGCAVHVERITTGVERVAGPALATVVLCIDDLPGVAAALVPLLERRAEVVRVAAAAAPCLPGPAAAPPAQPRRFGAAPTSAGRASADSAGASRGAPGRARRFGVGPTSGGRGPADPAGAELADLDGPVVLVVDERQRELGDVTAWSALVVVTTDRVEFRQARSGDPALAATGHAVETAHLIDAFVRDPSRFAPGTFRARARP